MRSTSTLKTALLALPLTALLACGGGGDATGPGGDDGSGGETQLTEEEVGEMMEAMAAAGAFSPPSPESGGQSGPAAVPFDYSVETTNACPEGGSVALEGSVEGDVDAETGAGTFNVTMTQTHDDCAATSDAGTTFTFNGSPNLETSMDFTTTADGSYSIDGSHAGTIGWATGDRSGTCDVDIAYDFSGSESSFSGSAEGTVCGVQVSESLDVGSG